MERALEHLHPAPERPLDASNDSGLHGLKSQVVGLKPAPLRIGLQLSAVMDAVRTAVDAAIDPPSDLPSRVEAAKGLSLAVGALIEAPTTLTAALHARVQEQADATRGVLDTAVLQPFARRRQRYGVYYLLTLIGSSRAAIDLVLLQIVGYWMVRRMLEHWEPSAGAVARLTAAVSRPDSRLAKSWADRARSRALHRSRQGAMKAISASPSAAAGLGFATSSVPRAVPSTPEQIFNVAFRRRWNGLTAHYTTAAAAGAVGHGRLGLDSLARAGGELADRIRIGDAGALHIGLELETCLTSELVDTLTVVTRPADAPDVHAWIDLTTQTYRRQLWWIDQKGARPVEGTQHLYEQTSQSCTTAITPLLIDGLRLRVNSSTPSICTVHDLLGDAGHGPYALVVDRGRYRCTVSRMQNSLPHAVLGSGHHRWPTVLALSAPFLVASGRRAYSACRSQAIQAAANARYTALTWPVAGVDADAVLVGGFVTPTVQSIRLASQFLAERADRSTLCSGSVEEVAGCLNAHAAWVTFVIALALALRQRDPYPIPSAALRVGESISFTDKDVHIHRSPPVPKASLLKFAVAKWIALCRAACNRLSSAGDAVALKLRDAIDSHLADEHGPGLVFSIDATYQLVAASYHTWHEALPGCMRLVPNFARHFWPLQLADFGVEQLAIDILMRHQFGELHPGASDNTRLPGSARQRLVRAMDMVLNRIDVRVPQLMQRLGATS